MSVFWFKSAAQIWREEKTETTVFNLEKSFTSSLQSFFNKNEKLRDARQAPKLNTISLNSSAQYFLLSLS